MNRFLKKTAVLLTAAVVFLSAGGSVFAADGDDNYGEWNPEWGSSAGDNEIVITDQPSDISVRPGDKAFFTVKAAGNELSWQWYYRKKCASAFSLWKGHTTATTSALANDTWDGMQVYCKITDKDGNTVQSDEATISLVIPLQITQQPQNISLKIGETATFTIKATGKNISCQWYYKKSGAKDWSLWKGHDTLTTKAVSNSTWNGMRVYCVVKDSDGNSVSSDPAIITLTDALSITSHPADVTASVGDTVIFIVKAQGVGVKYQWYYKKAGVSTWSLWKGHTTAATTALANSTWDGMQVYCEVKDSIGNSAKSKSAVIKLKGMPSISVHPADVAVKAGETAAFTVKAQGSNLKYQWYYKKAGASTWSLWRGHTTATTTALANSTWNGMKVYCVVTDGFGRTASSNPSTIKLSGAA